MDVETLKRQAVISVYGKPMFPSYAISLQSQKSGNYLDFATFFVILEQRRSQRHQQGDDVLRQAERILMISKQEGGQSVIRCDSH